MSDVRKDEWVRLSAKRELTPEEESRLESHLAANPSLRVAWEEERALSRAVQSLPDAPVSSNFTARVMGEIELDENQAERRTTGSWLGVFWPRLGWATAIILAVLLVAQYNSRNQERLIRDIVDVSRDIRRMPEGKLLQDFEVIERLSHAAPSDDELLAALQ